MLNVNVAGQLAGTLFKSALDRNRYCFGYQEQCLAQNAISLSMPLTKEQYFSDYKLHPIFDMNLPEGALLERLHKIYSKTVVHFDDLILLGIIGKSQIGRLQFSSPNDNTTIMPAHNLSELLIHDGAEGLFESLLNRYAQYSGVSGIQPKVLIREESFVDVDRLTYRGATHIVKAWNADEFPELAANEYFCLRATEHAKLQVPAYELSKNAKFLILKRFDLENGCYLGFEDFCVLNGKTSDQKYEGSYENICKRIKGFISPELVPSALETFFKSLALSCIVKNGDAHLKNFGVLYNNTESIVRLAPVYDIISTTPYIQGDILALTLGGSKRWPKAKELIAFARTHCDLTELNAKELLHEVTSGVSNTFIEVKNYIDKNMSFKVIGERMLSAWDNGIKLSGLA